MNSSNKTPLAGKRILVPPARPEANPLIRILTRWGADAYAFPALQTAPPNDYGPMDDAIRRLPTFDCIVFSGSNCVANFLERMDLIHGDTQVFTSLQVAAVGHGAVSALKQASVAIDLAPRVHTADAVVAELGKISGRAFLLVRVDGASRKLPQALQHLGATLTEVAGYRMEVQADGETAKKVFGQKVDALALANPTAVRFFLKGMADLGLVLEDTLGGALIAAVGPATAQAARQRGLNPHVVSKGHIADLAETLVEALRALR